MNEFTAIIMAAGRGTRMGEKGELRPKGLMEMGGKRLVERSVDLLLAHGVREVRIVTGHLAEQYQEAFGNTPGVTLVNNPDYATTGSLLSMLRGMQGVQGPMILLEADIVYERRALAPMQVGRTAMTISGVTNATDEVYVWVRDGENGLPAFVDMHKNIAHRDDPWFGELTGISCFSAEDAKRMQDAGRRVLASDPKSDYEPAMGVLAQDRDVTCYMIEDLAWSEIDNEDMLANAIDNVWPRILANDARPPVSA